MSTEHTNLRRGVWTALLGVATACSAGGLSCGAPDVNRLTVVIQPDFDTYKTQVDPYLERRCGTLDCHGQPGRGYRMYGRTGIRLTTGGGDDAGLVSGQQATTNDEILANYQAIVGLEPEELNRVMAAQGADEELKRWIWIRKPLKIERHKGGPAMAEDDSGYRCVVSWLRIPVVDGEGNPIDPAKRIKLTAQQMSLCTQAQAFP